jgi:hypothetical protein
VGIFVKMTEMAQIIGLFFSAVKVVNWFSQKMDFATSWATLFKNAS